MTIVKYSLLNKEAGATQQQIYSAAKKLKITPEELLQLVNNADPTKEKKFEAWLIKQLVFKNIRLPEDQPRVLQVLQNFMLYSNKGDLKYKDIARYKKIHDLERELNSLRTEIFDPREEMTVETLKSFPGVDVFEGNQYDIAIVSDISSLETLGLGTQWCTRRDYPGGSLAQRYLEQSLTGRVYIVYTRNLGDDSLERKYQFEDTFGQVMDEDDDYVNIDYNLSEDIIDMFWQKNIPNGKTALLYLAGVIGEFESFPDLIYGEELDPKGVENYLEQKFKQSSPDRIDWELAIQYDIKNDGFEYVSLYDCGNVNVIINYALEVLKTRFPELEEILLDPDFFKDRNLDQVNSSELLAYYTRLVLPDIKEQQTQEIDWDEEEKASPSEQKKLWKEFFIRVITTKDYRIEIDEGDLLEIIKITGYSSPKVKEILQRDPALYKEYKDWMLKTGYIPELIEHDYELSEAEE